MTSQKLEASNTKAFVIWQPPPFNPLRESLVHDDTALCRNLSFRYLVISSWMSKDKKNTDIAEKERQKDDGENGEDDDDDWYL